MKSFLNGLGVFGSIILTIILTILIFLYGIVLNIKFVVSENGMTDTLKKIDVVETLKTAEDGTVWEDFKQLAENLNLTENQFEQILNSNKVKEQVGGYIGEVLSSIFNDKEVNLTKEEMEKFLNIAVAEYNKVSDTKISDTEKQEIIDSLDDEVIADINEELGSINLKEKVSKEYVQYIELTDNLLFGNYTLILLLVIFLVIALIALFRFSYYKWIAYVKTSTIISGILLVIVGILLLFIPLEELEIIMPLRKILATNVFITSVVLFILSIGLIFGKKYLMKLIDKENTTEKKSNTIRSKEKKKIEFDKKTILIIVLVLMLILSILFLVFRKKESYIITFDTNGGSENIHIEVENNEIVQLPEIPTKEGYTFVGWTNKDGKIITAGIKVDKNTTLKAEWISNDADKITTKFNTDGGNEINNILIEKGKTILLPTDPIKEGYKFVGWFDENDNFITNDTIINNNITLKAKWVKKDIKTSTVKLEDEDGDTIGNILVENGNKIVLPLNPIKVGYKFLGWFDEKGNEITNNTIINKNTTIKANWKELYTCPSNCTRIEDGSKCVKTSTTDLVTYTGCPDGTETIEKFCSTHKWQVTVGFGEDQTYETAGVLCSGNPTNYCVDYNSRYTHYGYDCPSGYFKYTYSPSGLDAITGCVKKYDKGGSSCPSGYTQSGNVCKKTETISCKAN